MICPFTRLECIKECALWYKSECSFCSIAEFIEEIAYNKNK